MGMNFNLPKFDLSRLPKIRLSKSSSRSLILVGAATCGVLAVVAAAIIIPSKMRSDQGEDAEPASVMTADVDADVMASDGESIGADGVKVFNIGNNGASAEDEKPITFSNVEKENSPDVGYTPTNNLGGGLTYMGGGRGYQDTYTPENEPENEPEKEGNVDPQAMCVHEFVENITKAATCTEPGVMTLVCSKCGFTQTKEIAATGHKWGQWVVAKKATCDSEGLETMTCENCKETQNKVIPCIGHTWGKWEEKKAATCEKKGTESRKCSTCGKTETRDTDYGPHKWGEWTITVEPTCTAKGKRVHTCSVCGKSASAAVAMIPHNYVLVEPFIYPYHDATCMENGLGKYICLECGAETAKTIPARGHDMQIIEEESKEPTCTERGHHHLKCSRCGYEKDEYLNALGHDWVTVSDTADCTHAGEKKKVCLRCGKEEVITYKEPLGHKLKLIETKQATCEEDGYKKYQCTRCKEEFFEDIVPALGHDWEMIEHKDATCGIPGYDKYKCKRCGKIEFRNQDKYPALEHAMVEDPARSHDPNCTEDGLKVTKCVREGCHYEVEETIPALGHKHPEGSMNPYHVLPKCEEPGKYVYPCARCGRTVEEIIEDEPPIGHKMVLDHKIKEPTCQQLGLGLYKCEHAGCDHEEEIELPVVDHVYVRPTTQPTARARCKWCGKLAPEDIDDSDIDPFSGETWPGDDECEHSHRWVTVKEPSCTVPGYKIHECSLCGDIDRTESIPVIPHTYGANHKCTRCGADDPEYANGD